jgi:hypothetical protein
MLTADEVQEMVVKIGDFRDELIEAGEVGELSADLGCAGDFLAHALGLMQDTRSPAERRADWEADRADDAISSGEIHVPSES